MTYYNARLDRGVKRFELKVTKFDRDLNVQGVYWVTDKSCSCMAGSDPTCKHRKLWTHLLSIVNSGAFWDFEQKKVVWMEDLQCN